MTAEELAASLARELQPLRRAVAIVPIDATKLTRLLEAAGTAFRAESENPTQRKAAEWFLDNLHLVSRAARQTTKEIPSGFWRRLPRVGPTDVPRVLAMARAFLDAMNLEMDEGALVSFVEAFQQTAPLTIAELWALPAMLRLATLEALARASRSFFPTLEGDPDAEPQRLDGAVCVERSIRVLRLLADIDWKAFFQHTSVVDRALREDPAHVYDAMVFESRDVYRKVVEELAWETERPELEVARAAIELASSADPESRESHVGHWLVDRGRSTLESQIGYRARGLAWLRRVVLAHPTSSYLGCIVLFTTTMLAPTVALAASTLSTLATVAVALLASIPLSSIAIAITQQLVVRLIPPRILPRLDFSAGIPDDCRTLVVIPTLVSGPDDVDRLLAQLELHALSSAGSSVSFAVLSDHIDSASPPDTTEIFARADSAVAVLNAKHATPTTPAPFHFLHRESRHSASEGVYMGWERKRGKLEELNRLLRGDTSTSFVHHAGDPQGLERIRYVLTLDADTQVPLGAAQRLVGLAAHPLNVPRFDATTGAVTEGYTIVQPRVETHPDDVERSLWGWIGSGDTALDIYTHAVSDVYQDLFGAGNYVGKGLYDVDAFVKSLEDRAPENTLCSHDLFEGAHGRVALASDVFLLEHYPQHVVAGIRRQHRWTRGDWQIAPWLMPRVPGVSGRLPNRLAAIDRWKIFDNLRRSVLGPSIVALVLLLIAVVPATWAWLALLPLLTPLVMAAPDLISGRWREALARWGSFVVLLPHDAYSTMDAIARSTFRMTFTHRKMLEWISAAQTARAVKGRGHAIVWRELGPASVLLAVAVIAIAALHPLALAVAIPLALVWLSAPEVARVLSQPQVRTRTLSADEERRLRRLARRTWAFFETFVTPDDQWLAPDNYQEDPGHIVAHRTSPTNIGLMLVAYLAAFDFGYLGRRELRALVRHSLDTIEKLERYRGHVLNWYETRTLAPLLPRYVSTVDSGNFAASLVVLAHGCREAANARGVRPVRWIGVRDTLELLEEAIAKLGVAGDPTASVRRALDHAEASREDAVEAAHRLDQKLLPELETELLGALAAPGVADDLGALREVRTWFEGLKHQVRSLSADLGSPLPEEVTTELRALADRADALRLGMDFRFLYDGRRKLFHIGYNATADRLDSNHYDLLASEARVASFLAIVERQVDPAHWARLGRPITRIDGRAALLSWGGTMFEYVMPSLFMRSQEHSLIAQSVELAVDAQIAYGKKRLTPWGVSESGFARLDARDNYQYRSFGVPTLGIRRGLEDDLVIAPYASMMAVGIRPRAVLDNLDVLEKLGGSGRYGLYEAIDFGDPERPPQVVRSHMAHHQGMVFAALDNFLNADALIERFHADPQVAAGDMLLSERLPSLRVVEARSPANKEVPERVAPTPTPTFGGWTPPRTSPQAALLGNGRLTTMVTDGGAGFVRWRGLAVIGAEDDPTIDADGTWIYVQDEASGQLWSATPAPTRARNATDEVLFHAHQVEMHHRDHDVSLRTEIGVASNDDVEVRLLTLHNESSTPRTLALRTFAEPILESRASARRHPAFSRMFVECERLEPSQHGVLAWRREREPNQPKVVVVQRLVWDDGAPITWVGVETDRGVFVGRRHTMRAPALGMGPEKAVGEDDATVDPAMVLAARVVLAPHARVQLALVTSVGETRTAALDVARRFGTLHTARYVMHDARREVARRLDRAGVTPELLPVAMQVASRLLLPGAPLRPSGELIDGGASRSHVWGHGISGDDPIMVVRVVDPAQSPLVREALTLHRFLREMQVPVDLVLLDAMATGYQAIDGSRLHEVISALGMDDRIGERAGIRLLATDQLPPGDAERIMGVARVLLDAERGSMADHLARVPAPTVPLPDFVGTRAADTSFADAPLPSDLVLQGSHGGFSADGREYVIRTDADQTTPAPWCNVISNADVGCLVSESSLGTTWSGNSGENRLTPWRNDPVMDAPAEVLYLRDEETAQVWSPTPLPAGLAVPTRVRHGAGYTVFERESHGLAQAMTVFVAVDAPVKIVRIELTNRSGRARRVTATYYAEWVLGALRENQRAHVRLDYDASAECLLASSAWNHEHGDRVAFLAADRTPHGYTCDRTEWIGRCGTMEAPLGLGRWGLSGTTDSSVDPCAVLQTHLDIGAGETVVAHFVLGQGKDREEAVALARRFRPELAVTRALTGVHAYWDRILGAVSVKTPSPAMDVMLNRWLLYQTLACRFLARSGFYQSSGAYGFRDQMQDTMGFVHVAPELVREHLVRSARHQFEEGDVLHWWHPPLDRGVRTRCSDDMVWLPYVVTNYVFATGDEKILDEQIPYLKAPLLGEAEHDRYSEYAFGNQVGSLLDHCRRALERASTEGPHGLPLMGTGDWNDGMNRVGEDGQGESVWLAWFLAATMREFARLIDRVGEASEANEWRARADRLVARVDEVAWDGAWYMRAFYDDGTPLGSSRSHHCRIDSISQSWSVLAGAPNLERSKRALKSADAELVREKERLVLLLSPPFHGGLHHPGYIEAYPPGVRENGGQYTHAATWLGCAYAKLGDGAAAERIFRLLNPILRSTDRALSETYRIEPYALAGDVYGAAPLTARGGWSWYTGAAAWMWRLGVESILGITQQNGELHVDPCIPSDWPGFEADVRVGEETIHVIVENPEHVSHGVGKITREGNQLRVTLGATAVAAE